jgi:Cu-Zn family superoxide dismutase
MKQLTTIVFVGAAALVGSQAYAGKPVKVTVNHITEKGVGESAGTITVKETKEGLLLETNLKGLPPGEHGFHLHEKGSCEPGEKDGAVAAGIGAGGHFDPDATKAHKGPGAGGHKGDLPKIEVPANGTLKTKLKVAGLTLSDVAGRAVMIHAGGDNYSDAPKPLGGGGARIACGVVPGDASAAAAKPTDKAGEKPAMAGTPAAPAKPAGETKPPGEAKPAGEAKPGTPAK